MRNTLLVALLLLLSLPVLAQRNGKRIHPSVDSLRNDLVQKEVARFEKDLNVHMQALRTAQGKQQIRTAASQIRQLCEKHESEMRLLIPQGNRKNGAKAAVNYSLEAQGPSAPLLQSAAILNYLDATRKAHAAHMKDTERIAHLARRLEHERNADKLPVLIERMEEWKKTAKMLEKKARKR